MGTDPLTGSHDQLVGTSELQVLWLQGLDPGTQTIHKVYGVETPILQVFWGRFEEGKALSVCVQEREHLGVFMESGSVHYTSFPFVVSVGGTTSFTGIELLSQHHRPRAR